MEKIKDKSEQLFWVHERGIMITLPSNSTYNIGHALINESPIPNDEASKLAVINSDGILKKRYPNSSIGEEFMPSVDHERRSKLLGLALDLTSHIVSRWNDINHDKNIAVLLYGSVAKSLVKNSSHESPSDIDLTVIGSFTDNERLVLRDAVQSEREQIRAKILCDCENATDEAWDDIRYAGTLVQNVSKLTKNNYSAALGYIGSSARVLYDPENIWGNIEAEAVKVFQARKSGVKTPIHPPIILEVGQVTKLGW